MEVITIDGTLYRKASVVSKEFKYTADYIGQLCRGKKVDAKLIGRTWYVSPKSLVEHREGRYVAEPRAAEIVRTVKAKERVSVPPVILKSATKAMKYVRESSAYSKRIDWGPVRYENDEASLLPKINRGEQRLRVELSDADALKVQSTGKTIYLEPEELPEVALKGTLKIESIADNFDAELPERAEDWSEEEPGSSRANTDFKPKRLVIPDAAKNKSHAGKTKAEAKATYAVAIRTIEEKEEIEVDADESFSEVALQTPRNERSAISFTPRRLQSPALSARGVRFADDEYENDDDAEIEEPATFSFSTFLWAFLLLTAVLVLGLTAFLEFFITASGIEYQSTLAW